MLSRKRDLNNSIFESVFLLMFSVILFMNIMGSSQITEWALWGRTNKLVVFSALFIIVTAWFFCCKLDKRSLIVGILLIIICLLISRQSGRDKDIIFFTAFAFFGAFVNRERFVKRYIIIASFTVALIIFLYATGLFYTRSVGRTGEDIVRLYLGFNYTTYTANYLFHVIIAYFFIKKRYINVLETVIIMSLNVIVFALTDTQAVFYELIVLLAVLWLLRLFPYFFKYRIFKILTTWAMPALAFLIFVLSMLYSANSGILNKLNVLLSGRLQLSHEAIIRYGFHLFGRKTEWATGVIGEDLFEEYFYVDSSYLNIALSFGIIILVFTILGFVILGRRLHNIKEYTACIALIFLAIHSFTDPQLFEPRYNPMILFLGAVYIYKGKIFLHDTIGDSPMENYNNQINPKKNEKEISVRTLFWHVLKKWYIILIVAGIIGAIATGYRIAKNYAKTGNEAEVAIAREEYEKNLAEYNRNQETYKKTIDDIGATLQSKLDYLSESELIKIDPNKEQLANIRMYFKSDGFSPTEIDTDNTANKIIDHYGSFVATGIDYTDLSEQLEIKPVYLQELVSTTKDYSTGSFTINAKSNDPVKSREILEYVIAQTDSLYEQAISDFGNFSIQADNINVNETIDNNLQNIINNKANEIKNLENSIKQIKQSLEKLDKPGEPAIMDRSSMIKDAFKFGAKVFAIALGGMIILMALIIICRRKVLSPDELNSTYNLREVAVITKRSTDLSNKYDVASEKIIKYAGGSKNILLVGDAPEKNTFSLMSELQERMPDISIDRVVKADENKETLEKLKNADAVLFVEKVGRSSYRLMDKNFDLINNWGKKIIGSIVL